MFSKNNLKYILILGIGFLWCSSMYLVEEQYLLNYMSDVSVNIVDMLFGSFAMALGMFLFFWFYRKNKSIKKIYVLFLYLSILLSISFFVVPSKVFMSVILCLICLLGSAGFGAAYHFSLIASNVDKEYRGRVFAIGYAFGAIGTYLLTLLPHSLIYSSSSLLLFIPLILINIFLITKYGDLKSIVSESKTLILNKYVLIIISIVFLMAIITSFSSNIFSIKNIHLSSGFAYPRLYYSIGLLVAGIIADKKREYLEVTTIVSLLFHLLAVLLLKENVSTTLIACLNYVFLAFFVVFRTTLFMDLKDKKFHLIYLAGFGLCITRIVEGLLVLIDFYFKLSYMFLIISSITILSMVLVIYILFFHKKFEKDESEIIKELGAKYKLSIQEKRVLELMIMDYTNQEIADALFVSINTVRNHVANIYKKTSMKKKELKEICILKTI